MGKKYMPSGYQIIDLKLMGSTVPWEISKDSSEDAKVLWETLTKHQQGEIVKPVLLHLYADNYGANITMLCTFMGDSIYFGDANSSYVGSIILNGNNLEINITEQ